MHSYLLAFALLAQTAVATPPTLPLHIPVDAAALHGLSAQSIEATGEHSGTARYSGVSLRDLLTKFGVAQGHDVSGKAMQTIVIVGASDGYKVVFSLAELDPSFTDRIVLIADRRNGQMLPSREGPYRLIVPSEKREGRWVRQVTDVEVKGAP